MADQAPEIPHERRTVDGAGAGRHAPKGFLDVEQSVRLSQEVQPLHHRLRGIVERTVVALPVQRRPVAPPEPWVVPVHYKGPVWHRQGIEETTVNLFVVLRGEVALRRLHCGRRL